MNWLPKRAFSVLIFILFITLIPASGRLLAEEEAASDNVVALEEESPGDTENTQQVSPESASSEGEDLVTLNFKNADIQEVIGVFAEKTGINMVVGPDVKATVN